MAARFLENTLKAADYYEKGHSVMECAQKFGISIATVYRAIKRKKGDKKSQIRTRSRA